jgi:tetratricopeptide (TPR) repeat protein
MRHTMIVVVALGCLASTSTVRAGLYIPGEPPDISLKDGKPQALPFDVFRLKLRDYKSVAMPQPESELRGHYLKRRAELLAKGPSQLTLEEQVALSGLLIRLRELERALDLLHAASRRAPNDFPLQSNYALVFHLQGSRLDALQLQNAALQLRPRQISGFGADQTAWLLRVEKALFDVQRLRLREQKDKGSRGVPETVDELFPVKFVGENGHYEAGSIAAAEKSRLPEDAIAVVQQLLLWLPDDSRLYWLLAELYNADSAPATAATIFDECMDSRGFQTKELGEHRRLVKEALANQQTAAPDDSKSWTKHPEAFWIIGGILAIPLMLLIFWQAREIRRRLSGKCRTGH